MLDLLNHYAHGYVSVPAILSCKKQGLFELLKTKEGLSLKTLAKQLKANEGHLAVALRLLASLDWLTQDKQKNYCLTSKTAQHEFIPEDAVQLLAFPVEEYLTGKAKKGH